MIPFHLQFFINCSFKYKNEICNMISLPLKFQNKYPNTVLRHQPTPYHLRPGNHMRQDSMDPLPAWCNSSRPKELLKPLQRRELRHQRCLAHSLVGTPNYIAPEVLVKSGWFRVCVCVCVSVCVRARVCVCVYMFLHENPIFTLFEGELMKYNKINIVNNTFFK